MGKIEKLDWDSTHFQIRVGKCTVNSAADLQEFEEQDKHAFDIVYLFCQPGFSKLHKAWFNEKQLVLMDRKQVFSMSVQRDFSASEQACIQTIENLTDQILDLTFQSGSFSRFKVDTRFSPHIFKMLYTTWITRSVNREIAKEVFGYFEEGKLLGFITYGHKKGCGDIGLLAVDDGQRGKGIGKKLVWKAMEATQKDGLQCLTVATQGLNANAIRFYNSCGFELAEELDIYHHWTA